MKTVMPLETTILQATQATGTPLAIPVAGEILDAMVKMVLMVTMAVMDVMGALGAMEKEVRLDATVRLGLQVIWERLVQWVKQVLMVGWDLLATWVPQDILDLLVLLVTQALQEPKA
jgi:hypothetical protein